MKNMDMSAFAALTRDEMFEELRRVHPAAAKGKSRATKEVLKETYQAILFPPQWELSSEATRASEAPLLVLADPAKPAVVEIEPMAPSSKPYNGEDMIGDSEGDGVTERVNPPMPMASEPEFTFREGGPRPFTDREQAAVRRFLNAFKEFARNAANSATRKAAKAAAYDLKVLGVLVHPDFLTSLEKGRVEVRLARRRAAMGVA